MVNLRSGLVVAALLAALFAPAIQRRTTAARVDEYQVKAAVLFNLVKFVDWPPETFSDAGSPLVMCILGVDPFGAMLDETVKGRLVGKRPVMTKRIAEVTPGCHLLFVSNSERRRLPSLLDRLRGANVLTVSEMDGFAEQGGMIGLVTEGDRVKFEINFEAVDRVKLKLSARLMALAAVRRSGESAR